MKATTKALIRERLKEAGALWITAATLWAIWEGICFAGSWIR